MNESIPLLKLSRERICRSQKLDYAVVSSLERDPLLKERLRRLRTVPGVGPITALTWALEIGDVTRFISIKQAISCCGLCGNEKSSAEKVMWMPSVGEPVLANFPKCQTSQALPDDHFRIACHTAGIVLASVSCQ